MSPACHRFWKCYKTFTFCSLLTRCTIPCACHAKAHLNVQKCSEPVSFLHFWLRNVLRATTVCTFSTSQLPKVFRSWCVLYILTSKCASRHNGVHFFDISTSKSAPNHFDLEMCFAPKRRALFRHRNFQKWSEREVFLAFSLANVLLAITACNFLSLIWPAGSAPAALASVLFDPPEPQIIGKTRCFATFLPFRAGSSFFWLFLFLLLFSSLTLPISAFHLSSSVHIVGSLTSKLPSNRNRTSKCQDFSRGTRLKMYALFSFPISRYVFGSVWVTVSYIYLHWPPKSQFMWGEITKANLLQLSGENRPQMAFNLPYQHSG